MKKEVRDWEDEEEVRAYLKHLLHKEAFDRRGLIYGMGHAIYSVSDPRAEVLKGFVESLAKEKGRMKDYRLYSMVEWMAPQVIAEEHRIYKGVSANVDFYSGFVYKMCIRDRLQVMDTLVSSIEVALQNQSHSVPILQNVFPLVKMPKLKDVELEGKTIDEEEYQKELKKLQAKLGELHNRLYRKRVPVIITYEGWDAAGKGGNIKRSVGTVFVDNGEGRGGDDVGNAQLLANGFDESWTSTLISESFVSGTA